MAAPLPSLELVVARYREELNWLRNVSHAFQIMVYDKSGELTPARDSLALPNIGREAHTYLYHIVSRYNDLADYTIFCQGKPFDHAYDFHHRLRAIAQEPTLIREFEWIGHIIDTDDDQGHRLFRSWSKNDDSRSLDMRGFYQILFGIKGPAYYPFVLGAQFAIHRDLILQHPRSFYEHALAISINFPDAAHCFERTWNHVFGVTGIDPAWLAGRQTVYLKPVKRIGKQ